MPSAITLNQIKSNLDRPSKSFQLFLSENKCSLLFQSLIERPGDLTKDDIADDLEWPVKITLGIKNEFIVSKTYTSYRPRPTHEVNNGQTSCEQYFYCRIRNDCYMMLIMLTATC